ncbi:6-hydroxymethylpterin diphosphokinase MptE-like protein [Aliiglaciecola aliphaticivorans]
MLKNIRLHIEKDEEKQQELDRSLAATIVEMQRKNINSFARNIPSLVPTIKSTSLQNHSLFNNKYGEINIVDYGIGRTLYGFHPLNEVSQQVSRFEHHSPKITLTQSSEVKSDTESATSSSLDFHQLAAYQNRQSQPQLDEEIECLVVLGCGLGLHLEMLLRQHKIKYLIVYEPQIQFFQCSALAIDWSSIFALAKQNGTGIFLQIEKDGRNLIEDIEQLQEHEGISEFRIFKHYNHPIFDAIFNELTKRTWADIKKNGFKVSATENYLTYVPSWTPEIDLQKCKPVCEEQTLFSKNLNAFKKFYPAIYEQFKSYTPVNWLPIDNQDNEVNLLNKENLTTWYGESPIQDCELNFKNFYSQPNKDGLVLGYTGTKLAHYEHYKFVKKTEELLKEAEDEIGELPETVASIIMFGLGVGYQVERLLADHKVEKLFICEPNSDFFYASLFAIDWTAIFEKIEKTDARIYLNIGDDGTNLFRDLLTQFHSIGPYILNNTYFYQSYYNSALNSAIGQLREQLQVVISMGEYFDHAYYGIAHTKEGMRRKIPVLTKNPSAKLSYDDKEVPIFIVGNGPSLDSSIAAIKEWREQVIVVSCGTALQALHRNGITPDFHAEIEQNRSTFDWASLVDDLAYLRSITLISCNGIHPDTCELYKEVLVAFKEGESSTVSALNVLGQEHFEVLRNAFPTVSNFVCDLFSTLRFTSIYLVGVDLGFIDVKHHHSKSSAYYLEDGEEIYQYTNSANTSLIVPGNFRATVNTKHEFKVSRQVIEQVTNQKNKDQTFYNCSDGAKINNTQPLRTDEILVLSSSEQKQQAVNQMKTAAFSNNKTSNFIERFENKFSQKRLMKELGYFELLLKNEVNTQKDIEHIINKQKEMLFASYKQGKSLLFYYLYGTVNYANAVLTKLSSNVDNDANGLERNRQLLNDWKKTISQLKTFILVSENCHYFDTSGFKTYKREQLILPKHIAGKTILAISDNIKFQKCIAWLYTQNLPTIKNLKIANKSADVGPNNKYDFVVYYEDETNQGLRGEHNSICITRSNDVAIIQGKTTSFISFPNIDSPVILNSLAFVVSIAIRAAFGVTQTAFYIPKLFTSDASEFNERVIYTVPEGFVAIDFRHFICISEIKDAGLVSRYSGTRGTIVLGDIKMKHLLLGVLSQNKIDEFKRQQIQITESEMSHI